MDSQTIDLTTRTGLTTAALIVVSLALAFGPEAWRKAWNAASARTKSAAMAAAAFGVAVIVAADACGIQIFSAMPCERDSLRTFIMQIGVPMLAGLGIQQGLYGGLLKHWRPGDG